MHVCFLRVVAQAHLAANVTGRCLWSLLVVVMLAAAALGGPAPTAIGAVRVHAEAALPPLPSPLPLHALAAMASVLALTVLVVNCVRGSRAKHSSTGDDVTAT